MRAALLLLIFLMSLTCRAQYTKVNAFTVTDGLPSNNIYRCVEDNSGFLWVATDAGIARFDGKRFQVFTTRNGLPDNEVLAVIKEKNGRIWVNCFKQSPAYFDEVKNRFINASKDSTLARIKEGTQMMVMFPLKDGGVLIVNEKASYVIKDEKINIYNATKTTGFFIHKNIDGTILKYGGITFAKDSTLTRIYHLKDSIIIDSIALNSRIWGEYTLTALDNSKLFNFNFTRGKFFIYSNMTTYPLRVMIQAVTVPEPFNNFCFTPDMLYILGMSGKLYIYNKQTFKLEMVFNGNYLPNSFFNDSKGNIWISTIDKGLLLYKKKQFKIIDIPHGYTHTSFLSIERKPDGTLLAGNYYGEVAEIKGNKFKVNTLSSQAMLNRQRKILFSQNKIFTFSEGGIHVNYSRNIVNPPSRFSPAKTAVKYNDSLIFFGLSSGLQQINTITEKGKVLHFIKKRVTALAKTGKGIVYFGSTDGLYRYNVAERSWGSLTGVHPLLCQRISAICATPDGLVWVATSGSGVVVLQNDKVINHIDDNDGIINNASRSITATKKGQVWLGTATGLSIIKYRLHNNKITHTIQNITVNDGLSHNVINEMLYYRDTVYAATDNGISIIPAGITIPKFNIPVKLVNISINQHDTVVALNYKLGYHQQNIQLQFAGIELGGHFKNLQYKLDRSNNWATLNENTLTVQLSNGLHHVQVRAVDVNNNISDKVLTVTIDIATPFWKSIWFWLIIAAALQLVVIYLVNQRQKRRKEAKLAREIAGVQTASLEQQAFTSLMNPHFMFNALNSIQHYINVQDRHNANRYLSDFASLIRKNFEAAQQSFIPLEYEVENIKIYLRLEQMRFNERFIYHIVIDDNLDADEWMIPTMILQPLLENALLHGLMPSSIDGMVLIEMKQQDKYLQIIITDNGIGIANSMALKENSPHKSRGMELIKKRIEALRRFGPQAITMAMSPAFDS